MTKDDLILGRWYGDLKTGDKYYLAGFDLDTKSVFLEIGDHTTTWDLESFLEAFELVEE